MNYLLSNTLGVKSIKNMNDDTLSIIMYVVWAVILVAAVIIELLIPATVSIWFAVGAVFAFIATAILPPSGRGLNVIYEFLIFAGVSLIAEISWYFFQKSRVVKADKKSVDDYEYLKRKTYVLIKEITEDEPGIFKAYGVTHRCITEDHSPIAKGARVKFIKHIGSKTVVEEVKTKE